MAQNISSLIHFQPVILTMLAKCQETILKYFIFILPETKEGSKQIKDIIYNLSKPHPGWIKQLNTYNRLLKWTSKIEERNESMKYQNRLCTPRDPAKI